MNGIEPITKHVTDEYDEAMKLFGLFDDKEKKKHESHSSKKTK